MSMKAESCRAALVVVLLGGMIVLAAGGQAKHAAVSIAAPPDIDGVRGSPAVFSSPALPGGEVSPPPCCLSIYSAGSALGYCYVLATESKLPLMPLHFFVDHLDLTGQFIQSASSQCPSLNPVWPDWKTKLKELGDLAMEANIYGEEHRSARVSAYLQKARDVYARGLMLPVSDDRPLRTATCEEKFFKLGFDISEAKQWLSIMRARWDSPVDRTDYTALTQAAFIRARDDLDQLRRLRLAAGPCVRIGELWPMISGWRGAPDRLESVNQNDRLLADMDAKIKDVLADCLPGPGLIGESPPVSGAGEDRMLIALRTVSPENWLNSDGLPFLTGKITLITNELKDHAAFNDEAGRNEKGPGYKYLLRRLEDLSRPGVVVICATDYLRKDAEASARELGIRFPIVLDRSGAVIGPHHQWKLFDRAGRLAAQGNFIDLEYDEIADAIRKLSK